MWNSLYSKFNIQNSKLSIASIKLITKPYKYYENSIKKLSIALDGDFAGSA